MGAEWRELPLARAAVCFDSRRIPVKEADRVPGPYPYYGASGVVDHINDYIFDGEFVLVAEDGENLRTRKLPIAFLAEGRFWVNNHAHVLQGSSEARTRFLLYALQTADVSRYLTGSTMPKLTRSNLDRIHISVPPLQVQDSIIDVLGALDDRARLLHQTNATLESIAQALFKSWFVDFDPVHAKAEGREPEGMDADTAALFPSEFEESELGLIPKGWRVDDFGAFAALTKDTVAPGNLADLEFEHYSIPAFDAGQVPVREPGAAIKSNKTLVPPGSVLISKLNPHIPRTWHVESAGERAVCSTEFLVWVPTGNASLEFIYSLAKSPAFTGSLRQLVTGTSNSHQRVRPEHMRALRVVRAPDQIMKVFAETVRPMLEQVLDNRARMTLLADLRDTLLPRLISGRLRIPEAEQVLAGAPL